ncbi:MAG TPA: beta-ketoacyl-[acyl-carrier-protein] synthase family protein [Acidimicrobiales bacterium]|nr:beta-ketoacyl-[acyl-carrier-protein] synthase family protein [Acidimicrobiales bacterium]
MSPGAVAVDESRCAAVTGIGVVTPGGNDVDTFWATLLSGASVARRLDRLVGEVVDFGCEVIGLDAAARLGGKVVRRTDPFTQFALCAALDAVDDAGLGAVDPDRAAVVVGNGGGGGETWSAEGAKAMKRGYTLLNPLTVPMSMPNAAPATIAITLGWRGPNMAVNTACASGGHALGEALRLVRDGAVDVVVAGGTEAAITPFQVNAFARAHALSTRGDAPEVASRPFDCDRDGFVIGEGAAFCVLEPVARARARGAAIHGLLAGYGRNCDAFHLVAPQPDGAAAARCMAGALVDAGLRPVDVVHVHAHGTSTPLNDVAEGKAIAAVLGEARPSVTSSKGALGHGIGAAGAIGMVAACLAVRDGVAPPIANLERPDPEVPLDLVAGAPRPVPPGAALANSFGFGGHNSTLVVVPA